MDSPTPSLSAAVRRALLAHPQVTEGTHRFGGIVFHLGGHELGHLHGERVADLPLPRHIRDELVASGRLSAEDVDADSDWVSRRVNVPEDVAEIVELFRISCEHAAAQPPRPVAREEPDEAAPGVRPDRTGRWRDIFAWRPRGN